MGNIVTKQYETVFYEGDIDTGVVIKIHALGTVGNVKIFNVTTRQKMEISKQRLTDLTGSGLSANDTITICTIRGQNVTMICANILSTTTVTMYPAAKLGNQSMLSSFEK